MTESNNLTGQTIGRYQLLEQLGQGGMAEVYKAHQPSLDRYVAIKVMHAFLAREEGFLARFQREAKNVAALQHPNIIQVFDFDVHNGMPYMVMEFIEGTTLKTHLENLDRRGQTLAFGEAVHIVREVGKALAYAHQRSMIHRDVKPANVLMGAGGRVILTDFGIAKILTGPSLTATGSTIGTPAYMSPEQSLGKPGDHRSDLYSLGVMLYQLATSQLPYDADTPLAVMLKHVNEPLPMPRSVRPDMPESLERIILKSMAKSPDDRFQSADEMLAALDRPEMVAPARARPAAPQPQSATVAVNTAPAAPPASRAGAGARPWLISLIGLMIGMALCLVLGVGAFALRGRLAALFPPAVTSGPGVTSTAPPTRLLATQQPDTPVPDNVTNTPDVGPVVGATQKVCAVSDTSGFADRSFNQRAYDGLLAVESKLGWDVTTLEAQSGEDYFPHLATFVNSECGLIVAVGFTMADAVSAVAQAHPDQKLLILDHMYDQDHANVWQAVYAVDQASFLAGYAPPRPARPARSARLAA